MPSRRGLPPVVIWRGVSPSHAAMSRPRLKARALPTAAASAVALIVPIPGIVVRRRTASSSRAIRTNSASKAAMRIERTPFAPQVFNQQADAGAQRLDPIFIGKDQELFLQFASTLRCHDPAFKQ